MKKLILTTFAYFIFTLTYGQSKLHGTYVGLEEMCWIDSSGKKDCYNDPSNPKWKWYHLSFFKFRGDSVFLDQDPIAIHKKDTAFSASDGAFYYYSGTYTNTDTTITINLTELFCDYCARPVERIENDKPIYKKRTKVYKGKLTDRGIIINGYIFNKEPDKEFMFSENSAQFIKGGQ